jgi:hypothetical protein
MLKQINCQQIDRRGACVSVSECGQKCFIAGKGSSGIVLLPPVEPRSSATYYFKLEKANPKDSDQYIGGVSVAEFTGSLDHFKSIKAKHAWGLKANGACFLDGERIFSEKRGWHINQGDIIRLDVDMIAGNFTFSKRGSLPVVIAPIPTDGAVAPALVMYKACWAMTTADEYEAAPVQCVLQAPVTPVSYRDKGKGKGSEGRSKGKRGTNTPNSSAKEERSAGRFVCWRTYGGGRKGGKGKGLSSYGSPATQHGKSPASS